MRQFAHTAPGPFNGERSDFAETLFWDGALRTDAKGEVHEVRGPGVVGESGSGKELIARALYQHSHRNGQCFMAVNCAALTDTLLESELFGHEKGAFTGALKDKPATPFRIPPGIRFVRVDANTGQPASSGVASIAARRRHSVRPLPGAVAAGANAAASGSARRTLNA